MGKNYGYYDHDKKNIREELDSNARIYVMRDLSNNIIGTLRLNYSSEYPLAMELMRFGLDETLYSKKNYCLASKLIIHPDHWKRGKAIIFMKHIYKKILEDNIELVFLYCFDKTLPFFKKFGFIQTHACTSHSNYGKINVLMLDTNDKERLRNIRSPFYKMYNILETTY